MKMKQVILTALVTMILGCVVASAHENVTRGLIALPKTGGQVFLGWRYLLEDSDATAFNVYRSEVTGKDYALVSAKPVSDATSYIDETARSGHTYYYLVKAVNQGREGGASNEVKITAANSGQNALIIKTRVEGNNQIERVVLADLNGDGLMDFVVVYPRGNKDPHMTSGVWSESNRNSDTYKVEAYRNDGTFLWHREIGWGIEFGVHYFPVVAWDIDGDGKAEVLMKSMHSENPLDYARERLTVVDGLTGQVKKEVPWIGPTFTALHDKTGKWSLMEYGDNSRNYIGIAYLDGVHPFVILGRGTYGVDHPRVNAYLREDKYPKMFPTAMIVIRALDSNLNLAWESRFSKYDGRATHGFDVADLQGTGRDQILWGEMFIDSNGNKLWSSPRVPYIGHPDYAMMADIIPSHPGLEVLNIREGHLQPRRDYRIGTQVLDKDGKMLWEEMDQMHVHEAMMAKFSDKYEGMQITTRDGAHSHHGPSRTYTSDGAVIDTNFVTGTPVRWQTDAKDLLYADGKFHDYDTGATIEVGNYGRPRVVGDFCGDFREEIVGVTDDGKSIYILTNTEKTTQKKVSFLYDRQYRLGLSRTGMEYVRNRDAFPGGNHFADDTTSDRLPEVQILSHQTGDTIKGTVTLSGTAESGAAITAVTGYVDGKERGTVTVEQNTWTLKLNTKDLAEGIVAVEVRATDARNHHASAFRQFTVDNFKTPVPTVTSSLASAELNGKTTITGRAEAEAGIRNVELFLDTMLQGGFVVHDGAWCWECDTTKFSSGPHVLRAIAYDKAGQFGYQDVSFTIRNPGHEYVIYRDRLASGWENRSYGGEYGSVYDMANKEPVHDGSNSIASKEFWSSIRGIYLFSNAPLNIKDYNVLEFYVYGRKGERAGMLVKLMDTTETAIDRLDIRDEYPEGVWTKVTIPLDKFKSVKGGLFSGIFIQSYSTTPQSTFFVDDIVLK
jgi:rhamnogalacturonan endolyase